MNLKAKPPQNDCIQMKTANNSQNSDSVPQDNPIVNNPKVWVVNLMYNLKKKSSLEQ
jgi:hypothetical protein